MSWGCRECLGVCVCVCVVVAWIGERGEYILSPATFKTTVTNKGGDTMVKVGGLDQHNIAVGVSPQPPRGVWGYAPPEKFLNLDSLRAFLMHSDSCF